MTERHAIDETRAFEMLREQSARADASSSTSRPPSSTATASYRVSRGRLVVARNGSVAGARHREDRRGEVGRVVDEDERVLDVGQVQEPIVGRCSA